MAVAIFTALHSTATECGCTRVAKPPVKALGNMASNPNASPKERRIAIRTLLVERLPLAKTLSDAVAIFGCFSWLNDKDVERVYMLTGDALLKGLPPQQRREIHVFVFAIQWDKSKPRDLFYFAVPSTARVQIDDVFRLLSGSCPERLRDLQIMASEYVDGE